MAMQKSERMLANQSVELSLSMPIGIVSMHPETWARIHSGGRTEDVVEHPMSKYRRGLISKLAASLPDSIKILPGPLEHAWWPRTNLGFWRQDVSILLDFDPQPNGALGMIAAIGFTHKARPSFEAVIEAIEALRDPKYQTPVTDGGFHPDPVVTFTGDHAEWHELAA